MKKFAVIASGLAVALLGLSAPASAQLLSANIGNVGANIGGYDYGYYSYPSYSSYNYPSSYSYSYSYPASYYNPAPAYSYPASSYYSYSAPAYGYYSYPAYDTYYSSPGLSVSLF